MFAGKKSAQIREILISESAWEEMTCLFAPSLKPYISSALSDHSPEGGWESKRQFIDTIIPLVVKLDGEHNSEKWKGDPIKRENTLRNRIDKWLLDDLRDNYDKFIRNKNKR
ncbi:hypothetical protein HUZ79_19235 [Klebsiella quasipneumoniae]|nr:hypothetical protein [Klebsiella quasipneumoniae]ULJ30957.1 hypothetical protein HUZ79_19235 [Klebsiella quasipneumoniae]